MSREMVDAFYAMQAIVFDYTPIAADGDVESDAKIEMADRADVWSHIAALLMVTEVLADIVTELRLIRERL